MMHRWEAWLNHVATLLVGGTGLVYAAMRYLMTPADEWAVVNHPWQPHVQHLHILVAPLSVFAAGVLWRRHVLARYQNGRRRRRGSGLGLILSLAPMVVSGYAIQAAVSPGWRQGWVVVHLVTSGLWIAAYATHQLLERLRRTAEEFPDALALHPDEVDGTYPRRGPRWAGAAAAVTPSPSSPSPASRRAGPPAERRSR